MITLRQRSCSVPTRLSYSVAGGKTKMLRGTRSWISDLESIQGRNYHVSLKCLASHKLQEKASSRRRVGCRSSTSNARGTHLRRHGDLSESPSAHQVRTPIPTRGFRKLHDSTRIECNLESCRALAKIARAPARKLSLDRELVLCNPWRLFKWISII